MNHCVPDFHELEEDDSTHAPSTFSRPRKLMPGEEEIMELLWQNGQVVVQSQNQRQSKKSGGGGGGSSCGGEAEREIRSSGEEHLFMQEDEMASWLQYPLEDSSFDRDFCSDLLYSAPPPPSSFVTDAAETRPAPPRPPIPQPPSRVHNFVHFSRLPIRPRAEAAAPPIESSTVVESNETPAALLESRVSLTAADSGPQVNEESGTVAAAAGTSAAAGGTCDFAVSSSPGGSRTSFSGETHEPPQKPAVKDQKRKAREADDNECQSEDIDLETAEGKKQACGSASAKRSRAAEVHNLSERRRRDRINEKMKALQELIPRCNKSDKASMLDEAIEYLKSLQLQVQMMSMGCGMVPMMYPGMQQYIPAMGLGMGMGMGMGMDVGMSRPMVPFPSMMPGSAMPNPAAPAAHMAPRYPLPQFHMQALPVPDPSRIQATNHADLVPNSTVLQNQNQQQFPNIPDPYQQFMAFQHTQLQNQSVMQHDPKKPSTSKDTGNP